MVSPSKHEELRRRFERQKEVRSMKVRMAKSVLLRINEELEINPDVKTFRTPLLKNTELSRYQLRNHSDEIVGKIALGRTIELQLDETVRPPDVVITLGPENIH